MPLLCYIGIHRWEWDWHYRKAHGRTQEITICRCRRDGCSRYPEWRVVDISVLR